MNLKGGEWGKKYRNAKYIPLDVSHSHSHFQQDGESDSGPCDVKLWVRSLF